MSWARRFGFTCASTAAVEVTGSPTLALEIGAQTRRRASCVWWATAQVRA